jgi:hypothetical protein
MMKKMMEAISINITTTHSVTFYDVYQDCLWLSNDPKDSIEARWGLKKCEMISTQTRTAQNIIAFIERIYRKRDPNYADFSIRQQEEILRRLNEEWKKAECDFESSVYSSNRTGTGILLKTNF